MHQMSAHAVTAYAPRARCFLRRVLVTYICLILATQGWISFGVSQQRWDLQSAEASVASLADPVAASEDLHDALADEAVVVTDSQVLGEDVEDDYHVAYIRQQPDPLPGSSFITTPVQWHCSAVLQELRPPIEG